MRKGILLPHAGILLLVCAQLLSAQNSIVAAEYYLDHDPGAGQGVPVAVNADGAVLLDFNVNLSAVSPGQHVLFVRVKQAGGAWSHGVSRPIVVETVTIRDPVPRLTGVEYFLDADPGAGAATATASIDLEGESPLMAQIDVDLGGLSDGLHTLFLRARDDRGKWGAVTAKPILVETVTALDTAPELVNMEYYLDDDPGFGAGTEAADEGLTGSPFAIDTGEVEPGLHTLYLRVRDALGRWSITTSKPLFVDALAASDAVPEILAVEHYLVAADGSARSPTTVFSAFSAATEVTVDFQIDLGGYAGEQVLVLAARDSRGTSSVSLSHPPLDSRG